MNVKIKNKLFTISKALGLITIAGLASLVLVTFAGITSISEGNSISDSYHRVNAFMLYR